MARNESHWAPKVKAVPVARIHVVDATTALETKMDALTWEFDLLMNEKACSSSEGHVM